MKNIIILLTAIGLLGCNKSTAQKPEFTEQINKVFAATKVLAVYNINGSIEVQASTGDKIEIAVEKKISGKTEEILNKGKEEFKFEMEAVDDTLWAYISAPWDSRPHRQKNRNDDRKIWYDYTLNYTIKVPSNTHLVVSTINNGHIEIANVGGYIKANNINGNITISNAKLANDIHSINGKVLLSFTQSPPDGAKFYTLNGKMELVVPESFSADCDLKSFNGSFYTDFPTIENLPAKVVKTENTEEKSVKYKLSQSQSVRFGKGGRHIKLETFNGNIYIKKG